MGRSRRAGSSVQYDVMAQLDAMVPVRDGVRLATDVYLPAIGGEPAKGRFPTLLERTPYGKRRPVLYQTAQFFARRGYAVVLQDVRGRSGSEGEWYFLSEKEGPDGFDTLGWIARQSWSDGQVGTMGLSYSTATQQALAVLKPPALKAQFLLDGGYNYFHRTCRHSGAFELGVLLPYAFRMAREGKELERDTAGRAALEEAARDLRSWLSRLPFRAGESPLRFAASDERWFLDMLTRSDYDDYWKQPTCNLAEHIDAYPDIPIFLQTSWYGHHVWATVTKFGELLKRHRSLKRLLIGPWLHGYDEFARTWCGDVDFGVGSMLDSLNDLRLRWFDHWLKALPTGIPGEPPIRIFIMGGGSGRKNPDGRLEHGGVWRHEDEWPLARTRWTKLYLHAGGALRPGPPPTDAAPSRYTYDPADPVPTIGGGVQNPFFPRLIQGGAFDQRGRADLWVCKDTRLLSERPDVLVFQTDLLLKDLEITGPIAVKLWASSSAVDTDFTAKLIDVYPLSEDHPEGFAMNLTDSIVRGRYRSSFAKAELMTPEEIYEFTIEPQPISNLFKAGHRLRLDISSSNFPRFDVNPNSGEPLGRSRQMVVAKNAIFHDAAHPSHVTLPIIP